ncbi:MAG: hypothetical protein JAY68_18490 [Candidatus Thiodiazotropha taylori]|nr:hypothetical protein [Candidatus Thiodiazotropha taylori]
MLRIIVFIFTVFPCLIFGDVISESDIVGEWEWLGNSMEKSNDLTGLTRTGPSIHKYHSDGKYEYITVSDGKPENAVIGKWSFKNDILSVTRPDNGTFNNKALSFENGVLETQDDFLGAYMYQKKNR